MNLSKRVVKYHGVTYRASTNKEILDNIAQDSGYRCYNHYLTEKGGK